MRPLTFELTQELVNLASITNLEATKNQILYLESTKQNKAPKSLFHRPSNRLRIFAESPHERSNRTEETPLAITARSTQLLISLPVKEIPVNGGTNPICDGDHLLFENISPQSAGSLNNQIVAIETDSESGGDQYLLRKVSKTPTGQYDLIALNRITKPSSRRKHANACSTSRSR